MSSRMPQSTRRHLIPTAVLSGVGSGCLLKPDADPATDHGYRLRRAGLAGSGRDRGGRSGIGAICARSAPACLDPASSSTTAGA